MIRMAQQKDVAGLAKSFERFSYEGFETCGLTIDKTSVLASFAQSIVNPMAIVVVAEIEGRLEGLMVAFCSESFYNYSDVAANVIMWNVTREHIHGMIGVRMWRRLVREAKALGAKTVSASYVPGHSPSSLPKVYERLGMQKVEFIYRMEVK